MIGQRRKTDFDVVFKTTWTPIRVGAFLHGAPETFERSYAGVMTLKVIIRRILID